MQPACPAEHLGQLGAWSAKCGGRWCSVPAVPAAPAPLAAPWAVPASRTGRASRAERVQKPQREDQLGLKWEDAWAVHPEQAWLRLPWNWWWLYVLVGLCDFLRLCVLMRPCAPLCICCHSYTAAHTACVQGKPGHGAAAHPDFCKSPEPLLLPTRGSAGREAPREGNGATWVHAAVHSLSCCFSAPHTTC